jgi:predicted PurR-regulated permease PerM
MQPVPQPAYSEYVLIVKYVLWLIGFGMHMPLALIILGVFRGFITFGFLDVFIGPTLVAVGFTLLNAWRKLPARDPRLPSP